MVNSAETRVSAEFTIQIGGRLPDRAAGAIGAGRVLEGWWGFFARAARAWLPRQRAAVDSAAGEKGKGREEG